MDKGKFDMNRVPIVFCFDDNYSSQAAVAIASLLNSKRITTQYVIYCIVPSEYKKSNENKIKRILKRQAAIKFLYASKDFDEGYEIRNITSAAYYRLSIHDLIPEEEKVIYSDVDVLIVDDLSGIYESNINENLIGAVKSITNYNVHHERISTIEYWSREFGDVRDKYINSGFLILNLAAIRKAGLGSKWIEMSKERYFYQDQDILNITCKNRIHFLPPSLCKLTYLSKDSYLDCRGILFSEKEVFDVINNPIILHYAGEKPWNYRNIAYADLWWAFLRRYPSLYAWFIVRYLKVKFVSKIYKYLPGSAKTNSRHSRG